MSPKAKGDLLESIQGRTLLNFKSKKKKKEKKRKKICYKILQWTLNTENSETNMHIQIAM